MLNKSMLASAITVGVLVAASPAVAATGHSSTVNGGASGTTSANAYTGVLNAGDTATDAVGVTPIGTITCTNATGAGQVVSNGGGVFPIGGTGPSGYLASIGLTTPANPNGYCSSTIGSLGNPYAETIAQDTNAGTGLWDVQGDWNGGSPTLGFPSAKVLVNLRSKTSPYSVLQACTYAGALSGAVNNTAHTLAVTGTLTKQTGSGASCPASIAYTASYALYGTTTSTFIYLTA